MDTITHALSGALLARATEPEAPRPDQLPRRARMGVGVAAVGVAIHIAGDVIPAFGTMIFAPLSDWRAQLPTTFIIDPYFTAIIVAGLIASANWKMPRVPAVIGLAVLAVYVGFQGTLYNRATA